MAMRLRWQIIYNSLKKQKLLSDNVFRNVLCMNSLCNLSYQRYGSYKYNTYNEKQYHKYLYFASYVGLGFGFFYSYFKYRTSGINFFPPVRAAEVEDISNVNDSRHRYNFIANVVKEVKPSVVYIEILDRRRNYYGGSPPVSSSGTGFIVKSDGLILTNAHVVLNKPHTVVQVVLNDGRKFPGVVEDYDVMSDLALVRIQCNDLPEMKLGNSKDAWPGEWVIAIGSPLSLSDSVTAGVISSAKRPGHEFGISGNNITYIQTDAAITYGNSGGPLVNLNGEAIGINSMKISSGISFAIPIDHAKLFLKKSEENKKRQKDKTVTGRRRYMGITMLTLNTQVLDELRNRYADIPSSITYGVLVWKVVVGSPAYVGGLKPGDIVIELNGKPVHGARDVYDALEGHESVLTMLVFSDGDYYECKVYPED